jgi:hypothetical protein
MLILWMYLAHSDGCDRVIDGKSRLGYLSGSPTNCLEVSYSYFLDDASPGRYRL